MSDTPRTDERLLMRSTKHECEYFWADFARQLERELAEKDKRIAELEGRIVNIQTANRRADNFNGVIENICSSVIENLCNDR